MKVMAKLQLAATHELASVPCPSELKEPKKRLGTSNALKAILKDEIEIANRDMSLLAADSRLGYHPEAHSQHFTCGDLKYKIKYIRQSLKKICNSVIAS